MLPKAPNQQPECNGIAISLGQLPPGPVRYAARRLPQLLVLPSRVTSVANGLYPRPWVIGGLLFRRLNAVDTSYRSEGLGRPVVLLVRPSQSHRFDGGKLGKSARGTMVHQLGAHGRGGRFSSAARSLLAMVPTTIPSWKDRRRQHRMMEWCSEPARWLWMLRPSEGPGSADVSGHWLPQWPERWCQQETLLREA